MKNAASIKQLKYKVNKLGALFATEQYFGFVSFSYKLWVSYIAIFSSFIALSDDFCAKVAIDAYVLYYCCFRWHWCLLLFHHRFIIIIIVFFFRFAAFCLLRNQKEMYSVCILCTRVYVVICAYLFHLQMASAAESITPATTTIMPNALNIEIGLNSYAVRKFCNGNQLAVC